MNQSRPQTAVDYKRTQGNFLQKFPSGRLLSASHLKNLTQQSERENKQIVIQYRLLEPIYQSFLPNARHFGSICDRDFQESSKYHQLQKFGISGSSSARYINSKKEKFTPIPNKKEQNINSLNERHKNNQNINKIQQENPPLNILLGQAQQIKLNDKNNQILINKNYEILANIVMKSPLEPFDQRVILKQVIKNYVQPLFLILKTLEIQLLDQNFKSVKKNQKLFIPFSYLKFFIIMEENDLEDYLKKYLKLNGKITLNYEHLSNIQLKVGSDCLFKDSKDFQVDDNNFRVIFPCLMLYEPNSVHEQTIPIGKSDVLKIIQDGYDIYRSKNEDKIKQIAKIIQESKKEEIQILPQEQHHIFHSKGFNINKRSYKEIIKVGDKYLDGHFRPPYIEIFDQNKEDQISNKFFTLQEFNQLIHYLQKHSITDFLQNQLNVEEIINMIQSIKKIKKYKIDYQFSKEKEQSHRQVSSNTIGERAKLNGILEKHFIDKDKMKICYMPPIFEIYDPVAGEKINLKVEIGQLQNLINWEMKFGIKINNDQKQNV